VRNILRKCASLLFTLSLVFFLTIGIIHCTKQPKRAESNKKTLSFNIREGKRLFLHYCAPCHGEDAEGSGRYFPSYIEPQPPDFINSEYLKETNENVIFRAINFGSKALGKSNYSPPYGKTLREEEIRYIIEYLKFLKMSKESDIN
jgi:mono/diheme cytochrome c family protein